MASINDLINQVDNPELKAMLQAEVRKLTKKKKFGLVFENHMPECTPLYDVPIKVKSLVAKKDTTITETYTEIIEIINNDDSIFLSNKSPLSITISGFNKLISLTILFKSFLLVVNLYLMSLIWTILNPKTIWYIRINNTIFFSYKIIRFYIFSI